MVSLLLGLVSALSWGLNDFCVRLISARNASLPALLVVLVAGCLWMAPLVVLYGDWGAMTGRAYGLSLASGLSYVLGGIGLYKAFAIGPVRLVSPITASYPVLTLGWAAIQGAPVGLTEWLAVAAIIGGIAVVAVWAGDEGAADARRGAAIGWALAGATGFALTFAFGQAATAAGSGMVMQLVGRASSVAGVALVILIFGAGGRLHRPDLPLICGIGALDTLALGAVMIAAGQDHPEYAAVAASVFGVVTILLAWRFLREPMVAAQWLGVALAFGGIGFLAL